MFDSFAKDKLANKHECRWGGKDWAARTRISTYELMVRVDTDIHEGTVVPHSDYRTRVARKLARALLLHCQRRRRKRRQERLGALAIRVEGPLCLYTRRRTC